LRELAARRNVKLKPAKWAVEVAELIRQFSDNVLKVGLEPDKSLAVSINPVNATVDPCQPIELQVQLRNTSKAVIHLGRGEMLFPSLRFSVSIDGRKEPFVDIATLVLACPRALRPGEFVKQKMRVDVGDLAAWLNSRPLDTLRLKIIAKFAGPAPQPGTADVLNNILPPAVEVVRRDLLTGIDRTEHKSRQDAYRYALRLIMTGLVAKDLGVRVIAARRVGSLLSLSDGIISGRVILPRKEARAVDRKVLVLMCKQALADPSDVVRAEMLASLMCVNLDADILGLFGGVLNDRSPLVKVRLVDLLGVRSGGRQNKALERFSKDKNQIVADLAKALLHQHSPSLK